MADVLEEVGSFSVQRLRTTDTSFLQGAVRPELGTPPIAIATGPLVAGPVAGIVGAGEFWVVGVSVPAARDVMWIATDLNFTIAVDTATSSQPASAYIAAIGDIADSDAVRGPIVGSSNLTNFNPGTGGTFDRVAADDDKTYPSIWAPLDPTSTVGGFTMIVSVLANAGTAIAVGEHRIDLTRVRLVGYPVNLWNTGVLWASTNARGS